MTAETVTVDVRQEHIDEGLPFNPYACPIALAARAAGLRGASMHMNGTLTLTALKGYAPSYWSRDASKFAERFDLGRVPVKPRSFTFERGAR